MMGLCPKTDGLTALWRAEATSSLAFMLNSSAQQQQTTAATGKASHGVVHARSSKVHHVPSPPKPAAMEKKKPRSVDDRLRAIMGPMWTEQQLQQRFVFGGVLGSGATSKVYAAQDTVTGHEVAIKVFDKVALIETRRSMVADGGVVPEKAIHRVRRRLLKIVSELEILQTLDHPNIIKYLGAYETSHRLCIVHELVDGGDLLEHLLTHGRMSERQAASVFHQLLSALQYCHDRHIYHRDLKLENVMITKDLQVRLIDFGLSEFSHPGETLKTICGTPLYCSPEVLLLHSSSRRTGFYGGPADVWSIGVLIFALLTGCAPFDDSDFARLREEVCRNRIAYPSYVSNQVKGLLKTVLVFDAHLRPTVKDMLDYCWFKTARAEHPQAALKDSTEWKSECLKETSTNRRRTLSCVSENGTERTVSMSASYEGSPEDSPKAEDKRKEPAIQTHLSCLEHEFEALGVLAETH